MNGLNGDRCNHVLLLALSPIGTDASETLDVLPRHKMMLGERFMENDRQNPSHGRALIRSASRR